MDIIFDRQDNSDTALNISKSSNTECDVKGVVKLFTLADTAGEAIAFRTRSQDAFVSTSSQYSHILLQHQVGLVGKPISIELSIPVGISS